MTGRAQGLVLGEAQAQRLLRVDVLAVAHGFQGMEHVPMVRRSDRDGVDVGPPAQLAEVVVRSTAAVAVVPVDDLLGLVALFAVDVANGDDAGVALPQECPHQGRAAVAQPDATDRDALTRGGRVFPP